MSREFTLEKVLTISARDYCEMKGMHLSDYEPVGVHSNFSIYELVKEVPPTAEVVVDYKIAGSYDDDGHPEYNGSGTALIPKNPKKRTVQYHFNDQIPTS